MRKVGDSVPLTKINAKIAKIAYICTDNFRAFQKLMAIGILPGRKVEIIHRFPSYVLKIGNTLVALGEEVVEMIYVKRENSS